MAAAKTCRAPALLAHSSERKPAWARSRKNSSTDCTAAKKSSRSQKKSALPQRTPNFRGRKKVRARSLAIDFRMNQESRNRRNQRELCLRHFLVSWLPDSFIRHPLSQQSLRHQNRL